MSDGNDVAALRAEICYVAALRAEICSNCEGSIAEDHKSWGFGIWVLVRIVLVVGQSNIRVGLRKLEVLVDFHHGGDRGSTDLALEDAS